MLPSKRVTSLYSHPLISKRVASPLISENKVNQTNFKAMRNRMSQHGIEDVGEKLRAMMPWIAKSRLVDKAKN